MLGQSWPLGLHGTAGHHALLQCCGLQATTGHGIRLHTTLQLGFFFGGGFRVGFLAFGGARPLGLPFLTGLPLLTGLGFLMLRIPPMIWCCFEPGWIWPSSTLLYFLNCCPAL
jgi:hypothetical protein